MEIKYAALKYSLSKNIGDEIQTLAALRFLPKVDLFLDRDFLNDSITKSEIKIILNGWFTIHPENWPPSSVIKPLFTSFHITHKHNCLDFFKQKAHIEYLKKHEPIGCRDLWTLDFLKKNEIKVYWSGCLTLTLKKETYFKPIIPKKIFFVDVADNINIKNRDVFTQALIPDEYKDQIEYVTHWNNPISSSTEAKLDFARSLLQKYANAKLVITTRLHCLLPCLAFGIPVYFIDLGFDSIESRNRFGGLIDKSLLLTPSKKSKNNYFTNTFFPSSKYKSLAFSIRDSIDWNKSKNEKNEKIETLKIKLKNTTEAFIGYQDNN